MTLRHADRMLEDLEALARRESSPEKISYRPPIHWDRYPDGVRIYRGDDLRETITPDMLKRGLLEELVAMLVRS